MLDTRRLKSLIAALGMMTLVAGGPLAALAQETAPATAEAPAATDPAAVDPAAVEVDAGPVAPPTMEETMGTGEDGGLTPWNMFMEADPVVKVVMIGLLVAAALTWIITIIKLLGFASLGRQSNNFVEAFRGAKSIADMGKVAMSEEFDGNPLADMAGAASQEVELSRQAGLQVNGEHRDATLERAGSAVHAVQASLGTRLAGGMQFLASVGSTGPFVGLFGTVYGIMRSFIGIANTNTTNLAVVAPGIAEALLATAMGLFAAIPAVVMYNYFQTRVSAYGARTEGYISELMNAISRQLDKGA